MRPPIVDKATPKELPAATRGQRLRGRLTARHDPWRIVMVALALAAGGLTGCGGSDNSDGDGDSESASAREIEPRAQQRAESLVLQLSDFPDGWRASPAENDEESQEEFRRCVGAEYSGTTIIGEAESQDFAMGESAEASSESTVFETDQDAQAALAELARGMGSSTAEDCFSDLLAEAVKGEDYTVGDIDLGELSFTPPAVEEGRAWQVAVPVEVQGLSPTVYVELWALRQGDVVVTLTTQDVLDPFDPELRDALLRVVAGRMSGASNRAGSDGGGR